ncbi:NAD-dependent succinate-semialdehyde dehydrogenase [Paractinoplanes durhamensis]|uniref:NAD-dependent succinate-semialdehyde dehydrogenase n=1 Tax=Paractinoplanes durhamensis TaxID=113563 RepID=A0ABQ3YU41_9ACTN|nr:NAD-dependent succinate-semialdehyde dehydrogenase [Actinoplanes durhamensis]GIE01093.1 NAD-dependent succinate-semialdehyde dehydrogenase [Actinoplanes durhamensis]
MSTFDLPVPHQLLLGGTWTDAAGKATFVVTDPATETPVAEVAAATEADVAAAVESATRGFGIWRATNAWERSRVLRRTAELIRDRVEQIALVMTTEQGKPLAESRAETLATADQYDWYADEARRIYGRIVDGHGPGSRIFVRHEPKGVVAAFSTWNFPALLASRKIAPALAAGCAVIVVPAQETPLTTLMIVQALLDAGLPGETIQTLTGSATMMSPLLIAAPAVTKVSLTGSVPVGQAIMRAAAESLTEVSLELGGHAPVLVFADADIEAAARLCVGAKFRNAGQVCASPSRFFVQEPAADEFTRHFVAATRDLRIGDGRDPATNVGPLTNARRLSAAEHLVADAEAIGASVAYGGRRPDGFPAGHYYSPTVLTGVPDTATIMVDEPFAPVAPIGTFSTLEDALRKANSTEFGLAGYVFTRDLNTAFAASDGIEAGMVAVNHMAIATAEAPFGGVKKSGFGREGGTEGILDYTHVKYVSVAL